MHLGALPPVFAGLDPNDANEAAGFLHPMSLQAGDLVMQQGEEDYTLAFVVSGAVQLLDGDVRVGGAGARDMLGEIELFAQSPRVVTAVASSPTHLQVLAHESWLELCDRGNPAIYNVERHAHKRIGERLRFLNDGIAERSRGTPFALHPRGPGLMGQISRLFGGAPKAPQIDALAALQSSPLFSWADPAVLAEIAKSFQSERYEAETVLCRQGEVGDKLFLVVQGKVDVVVLIGTTHAETIATLAPGEAFGDAALAQNAPRSASCVSHEPVVALTMMRDKYGELWAADDPIGSVFRQAMLKNAIAQFLPTERRFVALEQSMGAKTEDTLRGTPLNSVWRD